MGFRVRGHVRGIQEALKVTGAFDIFASARIWRAHSGDAGTGHPWQTLSSTTLHTRSKNDSCMAEF